MGRTFVLHTQRQGVLVISEEEAIENALQQERDGYKPMYQPWDEKKQEAWGNPGWLVWSTYQDGCGVVYRRDDGKMILVHGWQGDFIAAI